MPHLIDSDWTIDHLDHVPEATQLLARLAEEPMFISMVTYMEVYQGAIRAADSEKAMASLRAFVREVAILQFSQEVAEKCAEIREYLRRLRKKPNRRALDLIVAATALVHDLTLVTRNVEDYRDIPGLRLL